MFNAFKVKNFRGISNLDIDNLKEINVFVGDNGSCKTTILDALYILLNPNNAQLIVASNIFRNIDVIDSNFWKSYFNDFDVSKAIGLEAKNEILKKVSITPILSTEKIVGDKSNVRSSSEMEENINGFNVKFDVNKKTYSTKIELSLQMPMALRQNEADMLMSFTPVMMRFKSKPDENYMEESIGHYFNNWTINNNNEIGAKFDAVNQKIGKEEIIDFLRKMGVPVKDIELNSSKRLVVRDERFSKRVLFNTYGDGVIHSFNIFLSSLHAPGGVTLIDEIENGLHWTKQKILWKAINKIAGEKKQQIFATTHSREMLTHLYEAAKEDDFLNKINLFRLERKDGGLEAVSYGPDELEYALSSNIEVR
ncbi:MAG: AAA family ATPase [Candidatus Paceibacterota bacterium]